MPEHSYACITSGAWADDDTLNLCCYAVYDYCGTMRISACFRDDTITIKLGKVAEHFMEGYAGIASGRKS